MFNEKTTLNEKMTERALRLRNQDFDPNYIPAYKQVERKDSGKKLRSRIRQMLGSNQVLLTLGMIAGDKVAYRLFDRVRPHKTLNSAISASDAATRITRTYHHYLLYGRVDQFRGRICEIGPGDTAGVSLLGLRYGAESADLVERFQRTISNEEQSRIYAALSHIHDLDCFKKGTEWSDDQIHGVEWFRSSGEQHLRSCLTLGKKYDTIISNAVLEHLDDPLDLIQSGVEVLNDGGIMLHQIDLDDHGIYSSITDHYDELSWLETPDWLYRTFAHNTGRPNRILFNEYKTLLEKLKEKGKIQNYHFVIRQLAGIGRIPSPAYEFDELPQELKSQAISAIKNRTDKLAKSLRDISYLEVAVRGFFLFIQK